MIIFFKKPTHFNKNGQAWINLRLEIIKEAKKRKEMIEVTLPEGECHPVDPKWLLKNGTRTEAVYLRPNEPMKLLGAYYTLQDEDYKLKKFSEQCL